MFPTGRGATSVHCAAGASSFDPRRSGRTSPRDREREPTAQRAARVVNDSRPSLARQLTVGDALHAVAQQPDDAPLEIDALDAVEFDLGAVVPGKDFL